MPTRRWKLWSPVLGLALLVGALAFVASRTESPLAAHAGPDDVRDFPIKNPIDKHVLNRLTAEKVRPSNICTDEEFIRRVYLDVGGVIPSGPEVKAFLADRSPDKRAKLVDRTLKGERYADHWTAIWGDQLREHFASKPKEGTERGSYRDFIKEALAENMPYNKFVREMITAWDSPDKNPAVNFYLRDEQNRVETTNTVSTVFMGTRMACAQCHDHPFDKWTQNDFHSIMAFFGRTNVINDNVATLLKLETRIERERLDPAVKAAFKPIFEEAHAMAKAQETAVAKNKLSAGGDGMGMGSMGAGMGMGGMGMEMGVGMGKGAKPRELMKELDKAIPGENKREAERLRQMIRNAQVRQVVDRPNGEYRMPTEGDGKAKKGGEVVKPVFPWDPSKSPAEGINRRMALADYVTNNRQFAAVQVNRLWSKVMGRGIVDPIDDFRPKNPPSHPELLEYLTDELINSGFDNHHVLRLILNSSTYQRSSMPNDSNRSDAELYSHARLRRLSAEQMFDSILVATGRAQGLADTRVADVMGDMKGGKGGGGGMGAKKDPVEWANDLPTPARTGSFMNLFNQPNREETAVVRDESGSISQALELMNGQSVNRSVKASPLVTKLINEKAAPEVAANELYLSALSRNATTAELRAVVEPLKGTPPTREWMEDLLWALLNAREFTFNK